MTSLSSICPRARHTPGADPGGSTETNPRLRPAHARRRSCQLRQDQYAPALGTRQAQNSMTSLDPIRARARHTPGADPGSSAKTNTRLRQAHARRGSHCRRSARSVHAPGTRQAHILSAPPGPIRACARHMPGADPDSSAKTNTRPRSAHARRTSCQLRQDQYAPAPGTRQAQISMSSLSSISPRARHTPGAHPDSSAKTNTRPRPAHARRRSQ